MSRKQEFRQAEVELEALYQEVDDSEGSVRRWLKAFGKPEAVSGGRYIFEILTVQLDEILGELSKKFQKAETFKCAARVRAATSRAQIECDSVLKSAFSSVLKLNQEKI